jgi:hypothetical protein
LLDGQRIIEHVTIDLGGFENDQLARSDRTIDGSRKARAFGLHSTGDGACFALHQAGAGDIAFDRAIDVEIGRSLDIALDGDVGSENRKG